MGGIMYAYNQVLDGVSFSVGKTAKYNGVS